MLPALGSASREDAAASDVPGNIAWLKGHGLALVAKWSFYPQLCFLSKCQDIKLSEALSDTTSQKPGTYNAP